MNPAALKANLAELPRGAQIIVNTDEFTARNLRKVGYESNPLEDDSLSAWSVHLVPLTSLTVRSLEGYDVSKKDAERAKNMFALGLLLWLYSRSLDGPRSSCTRSSPTSRKSSKPISRHCTRGTTTATPPKTSPSSTRSRQPSCRPGPTGTSPATSRSRTA